VGKMSPLLHTDDPQSYHVDPFWLIVTDLAINILICVYIYNVMPPSYKLVYLPQ
jgi:hypothetical protein